MSTPTHDIEPNYLYTYPSRRDYQDFSKSTINALTVTDPAKKGKDYGIVDPKVTKAATTGVTNGG